MSPSIGSGNKLKDINTSDHKVENPNPQQLNIRFYQAGANTQI